MHRIPHRLVDFPSDRHLEWVRSPAKYKAFLGGNRSGKTETAAIEVVWSILGDHPFRQITTPQHWRVHVPSYPQLEAVVKEKFHKYIPREALYGGAWDKGWNDKYHILRLKNGSKVTFSTHKSDLLAMEGASLHGVWIDEECSYEQYKSLLFRLLDTDGRMLVTATPITGVTWIYDEFVVPFERGDPNYFVSFISSYENKYLSPDVIADLEAKITDEERDIRLYGRIKNLTRRVFVVDSENISEFPTPPSTAEWFIGFDWGFEHPSALVLGCKYQNVVYVVDEWEKRRVPLSACGMQIENWLHEYGIPKSRCIIVYDSSLNRKDVNGVLEIAPLRQFGFRTVPSTKSHFHSIERVNEYLREGRVMIHVRCKRLIEATQRFYVRNSKISEDDPNKDICDAFRYMVYYALGRQEEAYGWEEEEDDVVIPSAKERIMVRILYDRRNEPDGLTSYYRRR